MAVDPGSKRIGLALSDAEGKVALPLDVIAREGSIERIVELVREHGVTEVVVGLPRTMKGSEGVAARNARELARDLGAALDARVTLVDERLTTAAAGRSFAEAGVGSRKMRGLIDKVAATILLQSYLDSKT